jgi:hypothetical protein
VDIMKYETEDDRDGVVLHDPRSTAAAAVSTAATATAATAASGSGSGSESGPDKFHFHLHHFNGPGAPIPLPPKKGSSLMRFASSAALALGQRIGAGARGKKGSSSSSKGGDKPKEGSPADYAPKAIREGKGWGGVGEAPKGDTVFVPFGKHIPREKEVNYIVSSGEQECMVCQRIIYNSHIAGASMYSLCNAEYKVSGGAVGREQESMNGRVRDGRKVERERRSLG